MSSYCLPLTMRCRFFLVWRLGLGLLAASPAVGQAARAPETTRPNIVLILADDMGYSDLGCFGSEISTPHLDALAARGVRFTNFYAETVCCPARAALLTGLHPHQAGVGWYVSHGADIRPPGPYQGYLNSNCVTLAEVLQAAGYRTAMAGKWHVGESRPHWPVDRGFERSFGLISGAANYFDITKDYRPQITRQMMINGNPYDPPREGFYMTDAIVDHAIGYIDEMHRLGGPFFLYVSFTAPHFPLHAPREDIERVHGRYREGWTKVRRQRFARMREMGLVASDAALPPPEAEVVPWSAVVDPAVEELKMSIYAAQVERMDAGVGRVLQKLRDAGVEENTWVFFLSDNGACASNLSRFRSREFNRPPHLGGPDSYEGYGPAWAQVSNTPLRRFKGSLYEGGIATSMIAVGPGISLIPGSVCVEPGHVIDIMPTLIELAGATYPRQFRGQEIVPFEGTSLVRTLRGLEIRRENPVCWTFEDKSALRHGRWKIVRAANGPWELYDLLRDRAEQENLAERHPERLGELVHEYERWKLRSGVPNWQEASGELVNVPGL